MFNYLTGYSRPRGYRKVLVAPFNLQEGILDEIERTIERPLARAAGADPDEDELAARRAVDPGALPRLAGGRAGRAQRARDLRAAARVSPGVSENIEVVSIVGRFLEHSRIYSFERPGEEARVYIGSADLMPRNLYNRVELVAPVEDRGSARELLDVLDRCLADNTNAWVLGADGNWTRRATGRQSRATSSGS